MVHTIFIDGSYMVFFRYFALKQWWAVSKQEPSLDVEPPSLNAKFRSRFAEVFAKKMTELPKKIATQFTPTNKKQPVRVFVGKDCPQSTIWRNAAIAQWSTDESQSQPQYHYKGGRDTSENDQIREFFKMVYNDKLFEQAGATVLSCDSLEADDCIALATKQLLATTPTAQVTIVTSDHDYLQLLTPTHPNLHLFTLKYKDMAIGKNIYPEGAKNLLIKLLMGDKSDNIPPAIPKCGVKTAIKYCEDREKLAEKLANRSVLEQFERNNTIINFDKIPTDLQAGFYTKYKNILNKY